MARSTNTQTLGESARIGILNRGEAALRFLRAVREYNVLNATHLQPIAFYIEAEENAPFVKQADEAVPLQSIRGFPGKQRSPYLDHELMIEALRAAKCEAVWPGWGFLSEDAEFVEKLEKADILFLGPSSSAMSLLGDKIEAKELAETADVPILPWSRGSLPDLPAARAMAEKLGYPVIIKAANAGGGRGIRFVRTEAELEAQFTSAQEETTRITGNNIVFMELLVERGRHLEVQVLADLHGNVNTLGVRDCSVQRKNQKIIEETPPPDFPEETIRAMEASAARLIQKAEYTGVGTVEYLYDLNRKQFYFMEVNTRLQVEHPITETLYQVDLVKGQIDVARGIEVKWGDRKPSGSVIEARLNAEDPDRDFSPSPGKVSLLKIPAGPGVRVDSGIEQGSAIPSDFDSMVAKVISFSPTRQETIARLRRALLELRIRIDNGTTNKAFLLELLSNSEVRKGGVDTAFVERLLKERRREPDERAVRAALIAGAIELSFVQYSEDFLNFQDQLSKSGRPRNLPKSDGYEVTISAFGQSYDLAVKAVGDDIYHIGYEGHIVPCRYIVRDEERSLQLGGSRHNILMVPRSDVLQCEVDGVPIPLSSDSGGFVRSPSPALVLSVNVQPGQRVAKGEVLVMLEAMKMVMIVEAPFDGVVREVLVAAGGQVAAGQPLVQEDAGDSSEENEETDEGEPQHPPVSIHADDQDDATEWQICRREFMAQFYGYDCGSEVNNHLDNALQIAAQRPEMKDALLEMLLEALEVFVSVEHLFGQIEIESTLFTRPVSHQELLSHYFRRDNDRDKGLPKEFLDLLDRAFNLYPHDGTTSETDRQNRSLFYMYRSHARIKEKHETLRRVLFSLEDLGVPREQHPRLSRVIDELISIAEPVETSVADAALHARYQVIDQIRLTHLKERQHRAIERLIDQIVGNAENGGDPEALRKEVVDAGPAIVRDLVRRALSDDQNAKRVAIGLVGLRLSRDRDIVSDRVELVDGTPVSWVRSSDGQREFDTIALVLDEEVFRGVSSLRPFVEWIEPDGKRLEILILVSRGGAVVDLDEVGLPEGFSADGLDFEWLSVGFFPASGPPGYRTFESIGAKGFTEIVLRRAFSPRSFRELRVQRLANFDMEILYRSENVILLQGTAKENKRDTRLFALCSVSEHEPEVSSEHGITRMVMLEAVFMEAIYAMRAAQARYKYRLQWNRIVLHNRSLLAIRLVQLRRYGLRLVNRTRNLGIERVIVYSRRKRWNEDVIRELELVFMNVSEDQFILRSRKPSREILATQDRYVTKVIRARQRKTVYPYEFIKMITYSGYPLYDELPRGEFEEFDIEIGKDGSQKIVSVKNRGAGENESNVVFGVITNYDPNFPVPLRRVIVLADPTTDLGSLAEPECRRVNAAIDLAERDRLPVEWIPISSGAKITLDTGTENLDWTAATLRRIIEFTQDGGEINIIVPGVNVGAQSYWNAEATMLMHTCGLLIMTEEGSMLLTGKKALEFSGGVSGESNLDIGGVEKIMGPNGQAQVRVPNLAGAYKVLFRHYRYAYIPSSETFPPSRPTNDPVDRDITSVSYEDHLGQGFATIGDIFDPEKNGERKKPFDMRQVMRAVIDDDAGFFERWRAMQDADTGIVWETRIGGHAVGMIGIESRNIQRIGAVPFDGPETWSGGTLFPQSSKKVARALNAFSGHLPVAILANLSGFDGSPESLRNLQLEYGAEIGRAVVNFHGPIVFVVVARYHGGAYVVFSKTLNPGLKVAALEGSYASVIGGAPAAAVVFPKTVLNETYGDQRVADGRSRLARGDCSQKEFEDLFQKVYNEKQTALGQEFDRIHSVERALSVGSIDDIIRASELRPYIIHKLEAGMKSYTAQALSKQASRSGRSS